MMPIQRSGRVVVLADGRACVPACVPYVGPPRPPSANLYVWCMGSPEIPPCRPLQMLDPAFVPLNPPQDALIMSAAYGSYMASSSNLRYQVCAAHLHACARCACFPRPSAG